MYVFLFFIVLILAISFWLRYRISSFHVMYKSNLSIGDPCRFPYGDDFRLGTIYFIDSRHVILIDSVSGERFDISIDQIYPA